VVILTSSYHKFAKDTLIVGAANVLVALSRVILLPLLTKTLGAHDYGIWAQAQVTIGLALGFVGLGLPYAMSRFLPAKTNKEEIREEFWSVFFLVSLATVVISAALIVISSPIANAFFEGVTEIVRITGLIILVWSLDTVLLSLFRAFRQMKTYALFVVVDAYTQVGLISFLVLSGYGLQAVVLAVLVIRFLILLALLPIIGSQIGFSKPRFSKIKEYLSFGFPTIPGNVAAWVVASSDRYIIGYFLGATSVGIYSAAYGLGSLMIMLVGVLGFVLPPTLSKLYDEGRINEVRTHLSYSLKYFLAVAIPFVCGAAILAKPILKLFSTAEISSQGHFVVPLVAVSILFLGTYAVISSTLVLAKKTKMLGFIWIVAALINLGLNIAIVPRLGILGATLTTLIAYSTALAVGSYYSIRELEFSIDWRFIGKSLAASGIMSIAIWLMHPQSNVVTIITVLVGATVYAAAIFLLRAFKQDEIAFFRRLIQRH
jgi:O-antigen/teichoic acid export membrane protein